MKEYIFNRKLARIIIQLADTLDISPARALVLFYGTETSRLLHRRETGLQLMSDTYIVNDVINELRNGD